MTITTIIAKLINSTMPDGYSWNDLGDLHIDHIIPKVVFNFDNYNNADFHRCFALKNLHLLPATKNLKKHANLNKHFQPGLKLQFREFPK